MSQRLEAAAMRLSELLGLSRESVAIHRSGKALLLSDAGESTRMLWNAQVRLGSGTWALLEDGQNLLSVLRSKFGP
eukprot:15476691-Alexandrium_andersonii.AAC.1